jgi:3'-phosphoadenosine 5'-phosphosulfate sulfotransferase (PAPS reductase)/FAD synthetase
MRKISTTSLIEALIAVDAPVAFGISGGKDSDAMVLDCMRHLDERGHKGERVLIHSHLGRIEHYSALSHCRKLAEKTRLELIIVRPPNEMIDRWKVRWRNNVARYANLECVKLILPWSTPSMRFCTSEEKEAPITSALRKRFGGRIIINAAGIRREESANRAKSPIVKAYTKLTRVSDFTCGVSWFPILDYTLNDVLLAHDEAGLPLNEVYLLHGLSRFSCSFCIMSNEQDLARSPAITSNQETYRELVGLETDSTFAFQSGRWLGDIALHLLSEEMRRRHALAKEKARRREASEARLPKHLLYTKGWPTCIPNRDEARLIAAVRRDVAAAVGLEIRYTEPDQVVARYKELMRQKEERAAKGTQHDE